MNAGSALTARSGSLLQGLSIHDRRGQPSRRFRQVATIRAIGVNNDETGLVFPGKPGALTGSDGFTDKFLLDSGVKTTRTVRDGEVSVTIKIQDRQVGNSLVGGYRLPVVGYGGSGYSADAARLRALQDEEDARRAALARQRLNNYSPSNLKIGNTIPASDLTMQSLAASEAAGSMAWGYDGSRASDDAQYNYYNLYRDGDPKEAVKVTADAGFGALAEWLAKQQAAVEKEFKERVESVVATMDEERVRALAEQKIALDAEFEERLAGSLAALRSQLEAAHYKDKIDALGAQKTMLEAEAKAALEATTARLTAEKEAALRELEARLTSEWQAKYDAMRSDLERQISELRERLVQMQERVAQMERDHAAEVSRLNAEHAAQLGRQREELRAEKEAALAQLKTEMEAERARALSELEARLQAELRATVERMAAEAQAALLQLREQLEQEKLAALADLERRLREEAEARLRVVTERLNAAELRVAELADELRRAQETHAREKAKMREAGMNGYRAIASELSGVLNQSIAGAMMQVEQTKTLTEKFRDEFDSASS